MKIPIRNRIPARTANEVVLPVTREVRLHPIQASVAMFFLLYFSEAMPQKMPAIEKLILKHAPERSP